MNDLLIILSLERGRFRVQSSLLDLYNRFPSVYLAGPTYSKDLSCNRELQINGRCTDTWKFRSCASLFGLGVC